MMADGSRIQIELTREQALRLAAATGMLIGTLELNLEEVAEGEVAPAQIPEAVAAMSTLVVEARELSGTSIN